MRQRPIRLALTLYFILIFSMLLIRPASQVHASGPTVSVWLTTADKTNLLTPQADLTFGTDTSAHPFTITVDETRVYQQMVGFGGTLSDGPAYLISHSLNTSQRNALMTSLFDPSGGIGLNFLRQPMGANDLALNAYTYDDMPAGQSDPTLASFSINHDLAYIIPLLQQALQINPDLKIEANPWGIPAWMKTNQQLNGGDGHLASSAYEPLAQYFVKFIQSYQNQGLPIYAVTPTNEPQYNSTGYPSVLMDASEEDAFVKNNLAPAFAQANIPTKILVYDHNWDDASGTPVVYPQQILADSTANPFVAGIAWHCYGGDVAAQTQLHNDYPGQDEYETECAGGTWENNGDWETSFKDTIGLGIEATRNWSRTVVRYALALDPQNGPHLSTAGACTGCRGLVTIDPASGAVTYNADYYGLGHFSKFVAPGAYRIGSNTFDTSTINNVVVTGTGSLNDVVFRNPDGSKVLVAYNGAASSLTFKVAWGNQAFSYTLPAGAAATFKWSGTPSQSTFNPAQRIEAIFDNAQYSTQTAPSDDIGGGLCIGYTSNGSWLEYNNVDFGESPGASQVQVRVAQDPAIHGGTLEFHLDSTTGTEISRVTIGSGGTGGWQSWQTLSAPVAQAVGVHNLYIVFDASINLNWFTFLLPQSAFTTLSAGEYTTQSGTSLFTPADPAYPGLGAGWNATGSYLAYQQVNFGIGASNVQARVAENTSGGKLEFHLDSPSGTLIGTLSVPNTGGWQSWQTLTTTVSGSSGVHDLYVVFQTSINLNWLTFATSIDDSVQGTGNNQFHYVGNGWGHCTGCDGGYLGMYAGSNSWDNTANDSVTISFYGTGIRFYGCIGQAHGIGAFSLDGGVETLVDFYATSDACNQLLWSSGTLGAGSHTLTVRVTGTAHPNATWSGINPDRVDILA